MEPLVSVIIPVYKVEQYLDECVASVVNQTYRNLEIILVDDGSPDACPAMCDAWAEKDSRIKVIHKENGGAADSRNVGLAGAAGAWVLFLDSDDYYKSADVIAKLVETAANENSDIVCFNYCRFYEQSAGFSAPLCPESGAENDLDSLVGRLIFTSSACLKLIKAGILKAHGILFRTDEVAEDIAFCAALIAADPGVSYCPEAMYVYRHRAGSKTNSISEAYIKDALNIIGRLTSCGSQSKAYMDYAAFQYCTLLINMHFAPTTKEQRNKIFSYKWLLRHDGISQVRLVRIAGRVLGIAIASRLLYLYFRVTRG